MRISTAAGLAVDILGLGWAVLVSEFSLLDEIRLTLLSVTNLCRLNTMVDKTRMLV